MSTEPRCKSCDQPILFARTTRGALMPVDATPDPDGVWRLYRDDRNRLVAEHLPDGTLELAAARTAGEPLHTVHWATCPHAAEHRRR